jgi:class 3 adenylate cyclase/streptogramin lyase
MPRRPQTPKRLLTTVLFTDIVGSTERAAEVGDKRWRQIVNAHHALVRRQLKRHGGREIDTAGDGFFATFDQPAEAILCAEGILRDVRRLDIQVRAGIHMGEVEVVGPKVGGIAVHIAARIMAKADPGQLLVSSTVRELVSGSGLSFEDVGSHELKGVPAQWHLYAVEPTPQEPLDESPLVVETSAKRRFPVTTALIVAGVVIVLTIPPILFTRRGGGEKFIVGPNTVVKIDPKTGKVLGGASVGTTPISVAFGDGMVWVANFDDRTLQPIDPADAKAGPAFGGLPGNPTATAVGGGYVWVTFGFQDQAYRIDPTQHNATAPIEVGTGANGVAFGLGAAWITNSQDDTLIKIVPSQPSQITTFHLDAGSQPLGVVVGAGAVWVAESLKGQVVKFDPDTGAIVRTIPLLNGDPTQVAFGLDSVWVTDMSDDSVFRIDPKTDLGSTIPHVGDGPEGIVAGPEGVWVANSIDGTVVQIDATGVLRRVKLGDFSVEGVTLSPGAVWVTVHSQS